MLKIYNAHLLNSNIVLKDYIEFNHGRFNTGYQGYGYIYSSDISYQKANYTVEDLISFEKRVKNTKLIDGFLEDFILWNPKTYETIAKEYQDIPKTMEEYEKCGLNEEGILLFADYITVKNKSSDLVKRIFGRYPETGLYLLKPDAMISMMSPFHPDMEENYEVLQSKRLGKQLALHKMDRKIN